MSDDNQHRRDIAQLSEDEVVAELIRLAGSRPTTTDYPVADLNRQAVARWEGVVDRRRRRRLFRGLAVAALAVAATLGIGTVTLRLLGPSPAPLSIGSVQTLVGDLTGDRRLAVGDSVPATAHLQTGSDGRAAIGLTSGVSIRLDRNTRIAVTSEHRIELERGAVYVDATAGDSLEVATPFGSAVDIGTLFQVRLSDSSLRVQVRDGRVEVRREAVAHLVEAGAQLILARDGSSETLPIEPWGETWGWILDASPAFELEGSTLEPFLIWLHRETGWQIRFDGADRGTFGSIVLHGSLEGVSPVSAPDLVLPGCGLTHRFEAGTLVITPEA